MQLHTWNRIYITRVRRQRIAGNHVQVNNENGDETTWKQWNKHKQQAHAIHSKGALSFITITIPMILMRLDGEVT